MPETHFNAQNTNNFQKILVDFRLFEMALQVRVSNTNIKNQINFWSVDKVVQVECQDEIQTLKGLYLGVAMIDPIKSYPRSLFCRSIQSIVLLHNVIDFVDP